MKVIQVLCLGFALMTKEYKVCSVVCCLLGWFGRETQRELPSTGSLLRCQQQLGLGWDQSQAQGSQWGFPTWVAAADNLSQPGCFTRFTLFYWVISFGEDSESFSFCIHWQIFLLVLSWCVLTSDLFSL